jgi:hypothetical protein
MLLSLPDDVLRDGVCARLLDGPDTRMMLEATCKRLRAAMVELAVKAGAKRSVPKRSTWESHASRLVEVAKYLTESGIPGCTSNTMDAAAQNGHLDVVRFLHAHRTEGCTTYAMEDAARNGHLDVVRFLHEHRTEGCTPRAMNWAASYGHLDVVRFLHAHRTEGCTSAAMDWAA